MIQLLPQSLANQIAAGEVVQRPASVVKELLENALDAGAGRIELVLEQAGKHLIQVLDDGRGMSPEDARLAFERHATSKIREADDLFKIATFGFRGEALASIAAVAQVTLKTRELASELGTQIEVHGGRFVRQEACSYTQGTSVAVSNLFYNVPARRKFLKSNPVEMRHILQEFYRVALAHPKVAFRLQHNGQLQHELASTGTLQRIVDLHAFVEPEGLMSLDEATPMVHIRGFVGRPQLAQKRRGEQYFFLNGRYIRNGYLHHAVMGAYQGLLQDEHQPVYFLYLDMPPGAIDINIHPTKTEVKFEDERALYGLLRSVVKSALGKSLGQPGLDLDASGTTLEQLLYGEEGEGDLKTEVNQVKERGLGEETTIGQLLKRSQQPNKEPYKQPYNPPSDRPKWPGVHEDHKPIAWPESQPPKTTSPPESKPALFDENADSLESAVLWIAPRWLLAPQAGGVLLIDQCAAHERVLYEQQLKAGRHGSQPVQQLLYPATLELPAQDFALIEEALPNLRAQGFELKVVRPGVLLIAGVPYEMKFGEVAGQVEELLRELLDSGQGLKLDERLARAVAKRASLRPGHRLSPHEAKRLVQQLLASKEPGLSPSGRPTMRLLKPEQLAALLAG